MCSNLPKRNFRHQCLLCQVKAIGRSAIEDHEILFEAVLKLQPKSWYHRFAKNLNIPHNMMTKAEGDEHLDLLIAIAKAYVESDLTWAEVEEIGDRMSQGYSFNSVVNELNLSHRVSPNLDSNDNLAISHIAEEYRAVSSCVQTIE